MASTHKPGEYVPRNLGGRWRCSGCGHVIHVQGGDVFPPCQNCGRGITWTYIGE
jgi:predicted RNA-binding Zn-ribbon protein involved in translation (DUF1610 family)